METSSAYNSLQERGVKFHEGWLEHKSHDNKWFKYWCVLKNNMLYFFNDAQPGVLKQVGTLTLDEKSKLEYKSGDLKSGFKFELYTFERLSYFKVRKSCEREIWKAYVEGITQGRISDTIDLLPGQIREIQDRLGIYFTAKMAASAQPPAVLNRRSARRDSEPAPSIKHRESSHSFDSPHASDSGSFITYSPYLIPVTPSPQSLLRGSSSASPAAAAAAAASAAPAQLSPQDDSGPASFFIGSQRSLTDDVTELVFHAGVCGGERPSWYFKSCTRQFAEEILRVGSPFGNTLMRSRPNDELDLAISKMTEVAGAIQFSHFLVKCHSNGYKIDVENPHAPMGSLTEVMRFFVETSGRTSTRPMVSNDLGRLGLLPTNSNPYNTSIITVQKTETIDTQKKRYPHTTRELSARNKHPSVMNVPFSRSGRGPLNDPNFFPPPPPPLSVAELNEVSSLSTAPILHRPGPNCPAPTSHAPPPPPQPTSSTHSLAPRTAKKTGFPERLDRSKSVPNISSDILAQVQQSREEKLRKLSEILQTAPEQKVPFKSRSFDTGDAPPPLPPNHPTAGKSELHSAMQAIGRRNQVDRNSQQQSDDTRPGNPTPAQSEAPRPGSAAGGSPLGSQDCRKSAPIERASSSQPETKASSRQQVPVDQTPILTPDIKPHNMTGEVQPPKVSREEVTLKRASFPQPEPMDELAQVTARVTKQPLPVKKGPEVAPKPAPAGIVSKARAALESDNQGKQSAVQPATPTQTATSHSTGCIESPKSPPCKTPNSIPANTLPEEPDLEGIVYAQLRQELMPCNSVEHADETYQNYHHFKAVRSLTAQDNVSSDSWKNGVMNYADMSLEPSDLVFDSNDSASAVYQVPWEFKVKEEETYEPVETLFSFEEDTVFYLNSKDLSAHAQDVEPNVTSTELYEPVEQTFIDPNIRDETAKNDRQAKSPCHPFLSQSTNDISDKVHLTCAYYFNENSMPHTPVKARNSQSLPQRRRGVFQMENESFSSARIERKPVDRRHSIQTEYECRNQSQPVNSEDEPGENQVHQSIHFKTSKALIKPSGRTVQDSPEPDEIYEGVEWKPTALDQTSLPGLDIGVSPQKLNGAPPRSKLPKANTLAGHGRASQEVYYAEVRLLGSPRDLENGHSQYIDVIANYEDIQAAKEARGSFSGPSLENFSTDELPMRRSKSEVGRPSIAAVATNSFKKRLGDLMLGPANSSPAGSETIQANTGEKGSSSDCAGTVRTVAGGRSSAHVSPELYENIDQYQNTQEILASARS